MDLKMLCVIEKQITHSMDTNNSAVINATLISTNELFLNQRRVTDQIDKISAHNAEIEALKQNETKTTTDVEELSVKILALEATVKGLQETLQWTADTVEKLTQS